MKLSGWAKDILTNSKAKFHYELPLALLQKLSGKTETSELLATAEIPKDNLERIPLYKDFLAVVFDRPASPGNLGTIIRSSDAFKVNGIVVTGHAVDVYDPETVSASTGSLFALPIVRKPSHTDLLSWFTDLREKLGDLQIVGTDEKGEATVKDCNFQKPTVLLVGNETWGLSAAYRELCNKTLRIPMEGSASSLNVASATSIILYEAYGQRIAPKE